MSPDLFRSVWPIFLSEARDQLDALAEGLGALESAASEQRASVLDELRRVAHSLKGSSASLGLVDIERLVHAIEAALPGGEHHHGKTKLDALLDALEAIRAAMARCDAGGSHLVPGVEALLRALGVELPAAREDTLRPPPSVRETAAPELVPEPLRELWPVFRRELAEHLALLRDAAAGRASASTSREIASSIHRSAVAFGLERLGAAAEALEDQLADGGGAQVAASLEALQTACAELLGKAPGEGPDVEGGARAAASAELVGKAPGEDPAVEGPSSAPAFASRLTADVAALESVVARFHSPDPAERAEALAGASERLRALRAAARVFGAEEIESLAGKMEETLRDVESNPARATTAAADAVMALDAARARVEERPRPSVPAPAQPRPAGPRAPGETVLRISTRAIDKLTRQVDQLLLLQGGEARRTQELSGLAVSAAEALRTCERAMRAPEAELRVAAVVLAGHLRELTRDAARVSRDSKRAAERLQLVGGVLREELSDLVMRPASLLLEPLGRVVHDVSRRLAKPVELVVEGGDVRLDRRIIDDLKDPLLHLVRNAVDHGLESPARRAARGKAPVGRLLVRVEPRGARVTVLVEDDGGGLELARIRSVALERGVVEPKSLEQLTDDEVARLIFKPGFSTSAEVTSISGRGIGLDVVADTVRRLHGTVELRSLPGRGTSFVLDLPLSLAARSGMLVSVSGEVCALPIDGVVEVLRLKRERLGSVAGRVVVKVGERQVPYVQLGDVIGLAGRSRPPSEDGAQRALLLESGTQQVVVAVDAILGEQALVVQPLGRHLEEVAHLEGAAVLAKGGLVPVLDVGEVVRLARPAVRTEAGPRRTRVLVADDSLTTRSAMKLLLEIAGYQVVLASNGGEAVRLLNETPCDLVVSDVEMPVLDGFALARHIKADAKLAKTPVVLVTSLASPEDRAQGLLAGADGYVIKREVESGKLLDLVRQLLPEARREA